MMFGNQGFMGGFMLIFWIIVIFGFVFLIKWIVQQNNPAESRLEENSLEILKRRYAKGEIDKKRARTKKERSNILIVPLDFK